MPAMGDDGVEDASGGYLSDDSSFYGPFLPRSIARSIHPLNHSQAMITFAVDSKTVQQALISLGTGLLTTPNSP